MAKSSFSQRGKKRSRSRSRSKRSRSKRSRSRHKRSRSKRISGGGFNPVINVSGYPVRDFSRENLIMMQDEEIEKYIEDTFTMLSEIFKDLKENPSLLKSTEKEIENINIDIQDINIEISKIINDCDFKCWDDPEIIKRKEAKRNLKKEKIMKTMIITQHGENGDEKFYYNIKIPKFVFLVRRFIGKISNDGKNIYDGEDYKSKVWENEYTEANIQIFPYKPKTNRLGFNVRHNFYLTLKNDDGTENDPHKRWFPNDKMDKNLIDNFKDFVPENVSENAEDDITVGGRRSRKIKKTRKNTKKH